VTNNILLPTKPAFNPSTFKESLLAQIWPGFITAPPGRAFTLPLNNPSSPEVSPLALVSQRLETLKKKALMNFQITMLRSKNTVTRFGDMVKEGTIPQGCMLFCQ